MDLRPILSFIILWIPISRTFLTSSVVSPLVKFSSSNSTWNSLCSVVLDHLLHINVILLSHSRAEDINILLKHLQHVAQKSVSYWNATDGLTMSSDGAKVPVLDSSFRGTSTSSGCVILLDNSTFHQLKLDLRRFWRRVETFLTPYSPVIILIFSQDLGINCDSETIRSLNFPLYYHAFIMLTSCADRVFFFDFADDKSLLHLTPKNLSIAHYKRRNLTANMRGAVFRVAMANFFPSAVFKNGTNVDSMTGIDAFMLQAIARHFNFTPKVVLPKDGLPFGVYVNGIGSGTLKSVVEKEADASFIGRFVMDYGTNDFDYTVPYQFDRLCVIVPKNPPFKMYRMLVMSLEPNVWLFLMIIHIIATVVWLGIKSFWLKTSSRFSVVGAFLDVYFFIASGAMVSSALKPPSGKVLALSLFFFNLVLIGTLQGMIYKFTTSPIQRQIHTLKELDESGMIIQTIYADLVNTFPKKSHQEVIQSLRTKVRHVSQEATWTWKPGKPEVAALLRKNPSALRLSMNGNPDIVLVDECPRNFFLSYILKKNHKILPLFNEFIYRCRESGLIQKWLDDTYSVRNRTFYPSNKHSSHVISSKADASLEYVGGAVFILGSGLIISLVVFLGEVLLSIIFEKLRKPKNDVPARRTSNIVWGELEHVG